MKALILSCNTGEGHNSCAKAVKEYFDLQGVPCEIADALGFISEGASKLASDAHVMMYRHIPGLFDSSYRYYERHPSSLEENSVVHQVLTRATEPLYRYLSRGKYNIVICTHVFAALMVTNLLKKHPLPIATCSIATDYTCSPMFQDSALDCYCIPHGSLAGEFEGPTTPLCKMIDCGIPVRQMFFSSLPKYEAKKLAGVAPSDRHLLMMCGSMGCGPMKHIADLLRGGMRDGCEMTIVCGTNQHLLKSLQREYAKCSHIHVKGYVQDISLLMDSADLYLTKPGGISVTEAAVKALPMVLVDAVAGCEEHNLRFFTQRGVAICSATTEALAADALLLLHDEARLQEMRINLAGLQPRNAAQTIFEHMRRLAQMKAA